MIGRVFVAVLLSLLVLTSREQPWADAHVVYDTTQNLVDHQQLHVRLTGGSPWFYAVRGGYRYGVFPLGNVVAMVPSYLAFKAAHALVPQLPEKLLDATCAHLSPALCMAGAMALLFALLRRRGATERQALGGVAICTFGTLCFVYGRSPYSEALQTLLLLWVVERALDQADSPTVNGLGWLGCAAGVLVNAKLVYVLLLPAIALYVIGVNLHAGRRRALLGGLPLALVAFGTLIGVALWHNWLKTGSVLVSGYAIPSGIFSGDLFAALHGFFFSSGKSLFLYAPPVVLGLLGARTALLRRRGETLFLITVAALVVLFNAQFRHWHADYCWGPRHLVALMPLAILLAYPWLPEALGRGRRRLRRWALGLLVGAGVSVQLLGASIYWDHYIRVLITLKDQTGAPGWFQEHLSHGHYIPSLSPLRGQLWLLSHLVRRDPALAEDAPWRQILPQPVVLSDAWDRLRPDHWMFEWGQASPQPLATALGAGLLTALLVGAIAAWRSAARRAAARSTAARRRPS